MPRIERTAKIGWHGNVARGVGTLTAGTGAFTDLGFSLPTRIGQAEGKTSPEELLAAAHGGCITMSLASELTQIGKPPTSLDVTCQIVMDEVEGQGHQIVGSNVTIVADVPDLDEAAFAAAVASADENCPFTALLKRAGATLTVSAELA
jgi:osmotically inducible protein OsmC